MNGTPSTDVTVALTDEEYDDLREFARQRGVSLQEAGRRAVVDLLARRGVSARAGPDPERVDGPDWPPGPDTAGGHDDGSDGSDGTDRDDR
jgi:hypothetical protein